jgi:antitoxin VapB
MTKRLREKKLLEGLNAYTAHADAMAEPLPGEIDPLEQRRGSVKRFERPLDGCWDYADDEGSESDELLKKFDKPISENESSASKDPKA